MEWDNGRGGLNVQRPISKQDTAGLGAPLPRMRGRGSLRGMSTQTDLDPKELRPLLHAEIDKLRDENVALLHRVALQLELEEVSARLDAGFDAD